MRRWGNLFYVGLCLLSSCSFRSRDSNSFEVPLLDKDRTTFLKEFPLLDIAGEMRPPVIAHSQQWPLGALIYMPNSGHGAFCSVSHIASGKIVANAHCVERDQRASNYFVVYYDVQGRKTFDRVKTIDYQGNSSKDDVAVMTLSDTTEHQWHVLHAAIVPTQESAGARPPMVEPVTIWAFNPTPENHPDLLRRYGGPGMKFQPRSCVVSRSAPRVVGVKLDLEGREMSRVLIRTSAIEQMHLFVDGCNERLVKGNSGSLISESANFSKVLGVYHWIVMPDTQYSAVEYTGNDGKLVRRTPGEISFNGMYGVGTAFEAAFANSPSLLNFFQDWNFEFL